MLDDPKVAVIILTLNQKEKTLRCLRSLEHVKYKNMFTLLFDNGSTDHTLEEAKSEFPALHVHYSQHNLGVASGRNAAANIAKNLFDPEYFLFLDNDTTVEDDFLDKLVKPIKEDNSIGIATAKIKCNDGSDIIFAAGGCEIKFWLGTTKARGSRKKDADIFNKPVDCISSGGCMLVRSELFYKVNGFDPVFNPYGPEDLDFTFKVLSKGYRSWYVPDSVIYHDPHPARSSSGGKITRDYMFRKTKHWFILLLRHAPFHEKIIFLFFVAPLKFFWIFVKGIFTGDLKLIRGILNGFLEFISIKKKNSLNKI